MSEPVDSNRPKVDFDHYDQESAYNPWPRWSRLRKEAPVAWSEKNGGYFVVSRYQDIFNAFRDPQTFSNFIGTGAIPAKPGPRLPPNDFDPPDHTGYRAIVNPFFSPEKVAEYEPWIREKVNGYVRKLLQQDSFDVVTDLAMHVTQDVTQYVLGITDPPADLKKWGEDLILQKADAPMAAEALKTFLSAEIEQRRKSPGTDVISALVEAKFDGHRPLTHEEIVGTCIMLVIAGLDTTTSAIGGSVWYLLDNPDAQQVLAAADDAAWRLALDELVRWVAPAQGAARAVRHDTQIRGCPMHGGQRVFLLVGSGNRDETEFADPDEVILDRFPNRHLSFGMGIHRCIGSHLAKAMLKAVLQSLLAEQGLSKFRLTSPDDIVSEAAAVRGLRSLPLVRA